MDLFKEHTELLVAAGAECKPFDLATITEKDVLVLIDCQNDFFPADFVEDGGRFGVSVESEQMEVIVQDGGKIVPTVLKMIDCFAEKKCTIVATKDCHSAGHCSFTTNGGGFPPHCVQGTKGYDVYHMVIKITHCLVPEGYR